MTEMVMGRNGSKPKISSHRQMASDTFILKFAELPRPMKILVRRIGEAFRLSSTDTIQIIEN